MSGVALVLTLAVGAGVAVQAVINSRLRFALGAPLWAAAAQFAVGLAALVVLALATRQPVTSGAAFGRGPWWMWTGGVFGASFIVVSILLTPRIGTALTLALTIVGQLLAALLIDHFGWFGATVHRASAGRLLGVALLIAGVVLLRWKTS